ncbi:MAG: T9SS type A sorting domain-containing protein [Paludibacteraceae bacterium]|nr:T9SS type A sorting domain-containing protein [Paludibacteraceae bacterium]
MKHTNIKLAVAALIAIFGCCNVFAQGSTDLLNSSWCTKKYYNLDYGENTQSGMYEWLVTQIANPDGSRHKYITTSGGTDPDVPISEMPNGATTSFRLGTSQYTSNDPMGKGGGVVFQYTVTQENAIFYLQYATMLEDPATDHYSTMSNLIGLYDPNYNMYVGDAALFEYPGDWEYQQPTIHFYIGVDGQEIDCTSKYIALYDAQGNGATLPGDDWGYLQADRQGHEVYYRPWNVMAIDLTPYIGRTISVGAEYRDCAQAGWYYLTDGNQVYYDYPQIYTCDDHHVSRLYLHPTCGPAGNGITIPAAIERVGECNGNTATYSAPEGFSSYRWFTSNNRNQTLSTSQTCQYTFSNAAEEADLFCTVVSMLTKGCSNQETTLSLHISNDCVAPEITELSRSCQPDQVVLQAPSGFQSFRWFSSNNRNVTLSTAPTYTYTFEEGEEDVYMFCELTKSDGTKLTTNPKLLVNTCITGELTTTVECNPARIVAQAPSGFTAYRWFTADDRTAALSYSADYTHYFQENNETVYLFCEVKQADGNSTVLGPTTVTNTCPESEMQFVESGCKPDYVTYKAPDGYQFYRWFTADDRTATLSTGNTFTYNFSYEGETQYLFCEMTSNGVSKTISQQIVNTCVYDRSITIPAYVCADAGALTLTLNYESNPPYAYDLTFSETAVNQGFRNVTGGQVNAKGNTYTIDIPVQPTTLPDRYSAVLKIYQQTNNTVKDTTIRFGFYVYYPSSILKLKWNEVIAVKNADYNGGYTFTAIRWYKNGITIDGAGDTNSYIYDAGGFVAGDKYWAELTRAYDPDNAGKQDGKTVCTCPIEIQAPQAPTTAPERQDKITLSADNASNNTLILTAETDGTYMMYNMLGQFIAKGAFLQGENTIPLINTTQGAYIFVFRMNDGTTESHKVLIR